MAAWVAGLEKRGLSASTIRQTHRVFALVLGLPRAVQSEQVYLTHAQVDVLAQAAGLYRSAVLFLAYTGVRCGEMAALRVRNLDLLRRRAVIAEAVAEVHGVAVLSSPKAHQSRSVPIPRFMIEDLTSLVAGRDKSDFVFSAPRGGGSGRRPRST